MAAVTTETRPHRDPITPASSRMAFLVSMFPCLDEMFILREMAALAEAGFDFDLYSLKRPQARIVQPLAEKLMPRLINRPYFLSWEVLTAQLYFLLRRPWLYCSTLLVLCVEIWRRPMSLFKSLALFPKAVCFARLMLQRRTVHVHAFWATFPGTMAWIAHRLTGLPYSLSAHAHDIYEDNSMLVRKLHHARFVMTCTEHNRRHLSHLLPERQEIIKLIYHGLDLHSINHGSAAHPTGDGRLHLLSIGTLYKTKGFDTLIEACALLKQQGVPFTCQIVGDGPEREKLRQRIARHQLQQEVIMPGYLTQEQLRPLRFWADVFILLPRPYMHWGIPNVYVEALAVRLPVIATPLNAVQEVVQHERTGLLVACDHPQAAAEAMLRLWRHPEQGAAMAAAGQKLVTQMFDLRQTSKQVIELFVAALASERLSPAEPRHPVAQDRP